MKQEFNQGFYVGDRVVYRGANGRIGYGTRGIVIKTRGSNTISGCSVAVRYDGKEGRLCSLDGEDPSESSIWCDPKNLAIDETVTDWVNVASSVDISGLF